MSTPQQVLSEQHLDDLARQCAIPGHASMIDHRAYALAILAKLQAAPQAQPEQAAQGVGEVDHIADSLTSMIIEWVGDGKGDGPNWKNGLGHIIKLRLQRLLPAPSPAVAVPYPLSEFALDQWWLAELQGIAFDQPVTADQSRAVKVAINLARAALATQQAQTKGEQV